MINRKKFFDSIRQTIFRGILVQPTVDGIDTVLNEWERRGLTDTRYLAYIFATDLGEVGTNMQPVREGFRKTDADSRAYVRAQGYPYAASVNGHVYYGRGLVQLTWETNYINMGAILGIDLKNNPDLALNMSVAVQIMFEGMIRGTYTGRKLSDYFNANTTDFFHAREIVNRLDRAGELESYAKLFWQALKLADDSLPSPLPQPPVPIPNRCNVVMFGGLGGDTFSAGLKTMILRAKKFSQVDYAEYFPYQAAESVVRTMATWKDPTIVGAHSFGLTAFIDAIQKTKQLKIPLFYAVDSSQYWYGGGPGYVPENVTRCVNHYQTSAWPFAIKGSPLYRQDGLERNIENTRLYVRHTEIEDSPIVQDRFITELKREIGV